MTEIFAIVISVLALTVSIVTAWLTFFYRGTVRMTSPSMVAFGYDLHGQSGRFDPKIMVRCLVLSTGERGHAIETLFLRLRYSKSEQVFSVWGINIERLERGGGLFVGKSGVTAWHSFNISGDTDFKFNPGVYEIEILARIYGSERPLSLWTAELSLDKAVAPTIHNGQQQVWFDREPMSGKFKPQLEDLEVKYRTTSAKQASALGTEVNATSSDAK
jgi:hypothetical protein